MYSGSSITVAILDDASSPALSSIGSVIFWTGG